MNLSKLAAYTLLVLTSTSLHAQNCTPDAANTLLQFFQDCITQEENTRRPQTVSAMTERAENLTKETVTEMATSVAAPEGFAERVNDTIADFLPLFQFAVNGVTTSDDKKSVTAKFNSPTIFGGRTALRATASEPQLFSKFEEKIVEGARAAQSKQLLGEAGDLSDLTYSFDWGLRRSAGNWRSTPHLFGREVETYQNLIDELAQATINRFARQLARPNFAQAIGNISSELETAGQAFALSDEELTGAKTFGELNDLINQEQDATAKRSKQAALDGLVSALRELAEQEAIARLSVGDLDAIDSLIANQPEFLVKVAYRNADEAVGQRELTATVSYEMGAYNFNRVFEEYNTLVRQRPGPASQLTQEEDEDFKVQAYDKVVNDLPAEAQHRFVFSGIYKRLYEYDFRHSYDVETVDTSGSSVRTPQNAELTIPSAAEWHLKVLYSKPVRSFLGAPPRGTRTTPSPEDILPSERRSRLDFSLEGIWVDEDEAIAEELRRKDRVVGRLTFTQPLANGMSIPVSIVYANRAEFLKDEKNILSAHVGISYKLLRASDLPEQ